MTLRDILYTTSNEITNIKDNISEYSATSQKYTDCLVNMQRINYILDLDRGKKEGLLDKFHSLNISRITPIKGRGYLQNIIGELEEVQTVFEEEVPEFNDTLNRIISSYHNNEISDDNACLILMTNWLANSNYRDDLVLTEIMEYMNLAKINSARTAVEMLGTNSFNEDLQEKFNYFIENLSNTLRGTKLTFLYPEPELKTSQKIKPSSILNAPVNTTFENLEINFDFINDDVPVKNYRIMENDNLVAEINPAVTAILHENNHAKIVSLTNLLDFIMPRLN
ncbi:Uncharacterised protein [Candidatus Tiddalikarchaeum anstoanum]|nr:Uncharacterised protein [Candidatus Tiddalikarchaeum anstoanum]